MRSSTNNCSLIPLVSKLSCFFADIVLIMAIKVNINVPYMLQPDIILTKRVKVSGFENNIKISVSLID